MAGTNEPAGLTASINAMPDALDESRSEVTAGEERYLRLVELSPDAVIVHRDGPFSSNGASRLSFREPRLCNPLVSMVRVAISLRRATSIRYRGPVSANQSFL